MRKLFRLAELTGLLLLGVTVFSTFTHAQENKAKDSSKSTANKESTQEHSPGIKVGDSIPEIKLPKQDGTTVDVKEMLKDGPVALIFYRSASW